MDSNSIFSKDTNRLITSVGSEVSSHEVDTWIKTRQAIDDSYKVRTIISAWEKQQTEERKLRKGYAKILLATLIVQLVLIYTAFFLIGLSLIHISEIVINIFIISVFGEVTGLVIIVVKYLFPEVGTEMLRLLEKL